jgi:FKBP-type peptidyl-prolyl cis-trans isomerase 2
MSKATEGNTVKIHFTGKTDDNRIFDSSKKRSPLEFEIGSSAVLSGIENGVIGMKIGEFRTVTIPPEEAFGRRRKELVTVVKKSDCPNHITPVVGQWLQAKQPRGEITDIYVTHIKGDDVTIDANHPLADHTLQFEIEMIEIK